MKKLLAALLVILGILSLTAGAWAADEKQVLHLNKEYIQNNMVGSLVSFNMLGDRSTKEIQIEKEALDYLDGRNLSMTIHTNNVTIVIPPKAFQTAAWTEAIRQCLQ